MRGWPVGTNGSLAGRLTFTVCWKGLREGGAGREQNPRGFTRIRVLCRTSASQHLPKEAWSYLHQCGYHPTAAEAAYTILVFPSPARGAKQNSRHSVGHDVPGTI